MKSESTASLNTKNLLAKALKKLIKEKEFTKISVSDIIRECDLNRKTFYYHFEDKYELLKWILQQEAINAFHKFDLITEYDKAIIFVMDFIEKNRYFLANIYSALGTEQLKPILYPDFSKVISIIIEKIQDNLEINIPLDLKLFLVNFYTEGLANIMVEWIQNNNTLSREKTINYIELTINSSIPNILKNYKQQNQ